MTSRSPRPRHADEIGALQEVIIALGEHVAAQDDRIAALEQIIASRLGVLPASLASGTITPEQAAYELGLSRSRISQLVTEKKLRVVRVGGRQRIDARSVAALKS